MSDRSAGILATGMYVPPLVRRNDWWSPDVVAHWMELRRAAPNPPAETEIGEGARRVLRAVAEQAGDPFRGTVERRVMGADMTISDMEERAAREAIARSGIDPHDIDLLLTHSVVPDHQMVNPACTLHEQLGLPAACLSMHTEATGYSSLGQLALAEASIVAGRARYALLVQSSAATRLVGPDDPMSVLPGDGATAIVMGQVPLGRGFLSWAHYTEGRYPRSLIMSVRGGRWFDNGPVQMHIADAAELNAAHLRIPDACAESVRTALQKAGCELGDVDFFCTHQGTAWLQRTVAEHLGLGVVKVVDVFQRLGYLGSASIPAALFLAQQEGQLDEGDLVVLTGGGTGMTYGAAILRWGST